MSLSLLVGSSMTLRQSGHNHPSGGPTWGHGPIFLCLIGPIDFRETWYVEVCFRCASDGAVRFAGKIRVVDDLRGRSRRWWTA